MQDGAPLNLNVGAMAPVHDEVVLTDLPVLGQLPAELAGVLLRNGPNPLNGVFEGNDVLSWWPEAAMLHGVYVKDGTAGYANRWVRSKAWHDYHNLAAPHALDTNPNVNIVQHAGEVLAMAEGGAPVQVAHNLETSAAHRHAALSQGSTAHPKVDPLSGELMTFQAGWQAPWLRYGVLDAAGQQVLSQDIEVPGPAMVHDMAITSHHTVLMDLPVAYDFALLEQGYRIPIRWFDERPARLAVLPRMGGQVRWFDIAPCFIQHVVNGYEQNQQVTLDVVRYPWYLKLSADGFQANPLGVLWRYVLDLTSGAVSEQQLDDLHIELPRINEQYTGRRHRYFYAVVQPTDKEMRGIVKYDLGADGRMGEAVRRQIYDLPCGDQNSEPVFVADPCAVGEASTEDGGWLMVNAYRAATDASDILLLNAADLSQSALATIKLPRRIPAGFHGAWVGN